jgi:NAD(P)-dependent dehydrogenase (short-subunit alcohol dehydrogenase family)
MRLSYDFGGSVAVVTGAARGVGRALVGAFCAAGAGVVAADRDAAGLAETCAGLSGVVAVVADVSDPGGAGRIAEAAVGGLGGLDFCVNNAAVAPHTALLEERAEVWDAVFAVNCRGTFLMTQAAAAAMIGQGRGGRIVNFSSGASRQGVPGAAAYAASRAAAEGFTRVAAVELAPYGILVNCVSPGLIDTQPRPLPPSVAGSLGRRIPALPLARPGEPGEVAGLVLWLCSSAASYMTGAIVPVDGGAGIGRRPEGPVIDDDVRYDWVTGRTR